MVAPIFAEVSTQRLQSVCGTEPHFWCDHVLQWTGNRTLAQLADSVIGTPLAIAAIVIGALIVNRIVRRAVVTGLRRLRSDGVSGHLDTVRRLTPEALLETREASVRAEQRVEALTGVLRSIASFAIFLTAGFLILGRIGVNLAPLLAGAGVVGIALGFGAQTLVRDFLSGIFILVEDQFGVGDIVDFDGQTSGVVEGVSLRMTRLRAVDGTVWNVPNGDIRRSGNKSQRWSRSLLDVEVAYDTDIEQAKGVIKAVADEVWRSDSAVVEEPEVWGVEELGASGIVIRLVVKTTPSEQYRVSRLLRERIKQAFDEHGIEIPFPQQTVWHKLPDKDGGQGGEPQSEGLPNGDAQAAEESDRA